MPRDLLAPQQQPQQRQPRDLLAGTETERKAMITGADRMAAAKDTLIDTGREMGRQAALSGRAFVEGTVDLFAPFADALAGMMNLGIEGVEAATGREVPNRFSTNVSGETSQQLTRAGVAEPEGAAERAVNFVGRLATGIVGGGRLNTAIMQRLGLAQPTVAGTPRLTPRETTLRAAQQEGMAVPPATARPNSFTAQAVEGAAGKLKTAQLASARNQPAINRLAARAVGLPDDAVITPEGLDSIRQTAGQVYKAIRGAGQIIGDDAYRASINRAVSPFKSAASEFSSLTQKELVSIADDINKPSFSADAAVDAIQLLRDKASAAFRAGDSGLGRAYRAMSDAMEGTIERSLAKQGGESKALVGAFRAARQLIAKTYTIEGALRGENVDAQALGRMLRQGKPLTGEIELIARFAEEFPQAARVSMASQSIPAYSPLDYWSAAASVGAAATTGNPAMLAPAAYSVVRPGVRNVLLSQAGQRLMTSGAPTNELAAIATGATGTTTELLRE